MLLAFAFSLAHCDGQSRVAQPSASDAGSRSADSASLEGRCKAYRAGKRYPTGDLRVGLLEVLPDLSFEGETGPRQLHEFYDPCATTAQLLVIRAWAGFCGSCRWSVAHTQELTNLPHTQFLDVLVANEWNIPASRRDFTLFGPKATELGVRLIDPEHRLAALDTVATVLPLFAYIDARTMRVVGLEGNPSHERVRYRAALELAELDHAPRPVEPPEPLNDERFKRNEWDLLRAMSLRDPAPPADPSNEYADNPRAATLGQQLFADPAFSGDGTISCATCHDPARSYQDGRSTSAGARGKSGNRNAPSLLAAAHAPLQFWDGRADSLWMQATGPFENELEFASSRLVVAHRIFDAYRDTYESVFAKHPLPPLSDSLRFPNAGKPGTPSYDAMTAADQDSISRILVNVGKAIAAFERTLRAKPSALDRYVEGDTAALTATEKDGLQDWFTAGCIQCHWGPWLTDQAFHNVRFPSGRADAAADLGAESGLRLLQESPFRMNGIYSDFQRDFRAPVDNVAMASLRGRFRTPSLRGVAESGPWGHGGTFTELEAIASHYGNQGKDVTSGAVGTLEPWIPAFDTHVEHRIAGLLRGFTAKP
jgi:cytochrome c peroxidase